MMPRVANWYGRILLGVCLVIAGGISLTGRILFGQWWLPYYYNMARIVSTTPTLTWTERLVTIWKSNRALRSSPMFQVALAKEMARELDEGHPAGIQLAYIEGVSFLRRHAEEAEPGVQRKFWEAERVKGLEGSEGSEGLTNE